MRKSRVKKRRKKSLLEPVQRRVSQLSLAFSIYFPREAPERYGSMKKVYNIFPGISQEIRKQITNMMIKSCFKNFRNSFKEGFWFCFHTKENNKKKLIVAANLVNNRIWSLCTDKNYRKLGVRKN